MKTRSTRHARRAGPAAIASIATSLAIVVAPIPASAKEMKDSDIANALEFELLLDESVPTNYIDTEVSDGIVTLRGKSKHLLGKERAARIAETVKGVRSVVNLIETRPAPGVTGKELQKDVKSAFFTDPAADAYEIEVRATDDGKVTLSGEVDSWQEKNLAVKLAKSVRGVTSVEDTIDVNYREQRSDFEIQQDIVSRLEWNTLVDDGLIDVDVENGQVILGGTVGSAAEKREARYDAWAIGGVTSVNDSELEVESWARDPKMRQGKYANKPAKQIKEALNDAFLLDPRVLSFKITPDVSAGGSVTLRGTVDNLAAKQAAERVARHTVGVTRVYNYIKVRPDETLADDQIQSNVVRRLAIDPLVEALEIDVDVTFGTVYLRGVVDSRTEKLQAEDLAARVSGVTEVQNNLVVSDSENVTIYDPYVWDNGWSYDLYIEPTRGVAKLDSEIKDDIESQFFWSPFVDGDAVSVKVDDGVATLTGTVDSRDDQAAATENAFEGGAVRVINKLKLK